MIILLRFRYPRFAAVLSALSAVITLGIAIACHASAGVFIFGVGSSVLLAVVRHRGRKRVGGGQGGGGVQIG